MPLIPIQLEQKLKSEFEKLEKKLFEALKDKADGIYHIQEQLDKVMSKNMPKGNFDAEAYKKKLWEVIAREWATALAKQHTKILAEDVSKILANEITTYIKTATVAVAGTTGTIT
jgi:hypothetical protein